MFGRPFRILANLRSMKCKQAGTRTENELCQSLNSERRIFGRRKRQFQAASHRLLHELKISSTFSIDGIRLFALNIVQSLRSVFTVTGISVLGIASGFSSIPGVRPRRRAVIIRPQLKTSAVTSTGVPPTSGARKGLSFFQLFATVLAAARIFTNSK